MNEIMPWSSINLSYNIFSGRILTYRTTNSFYNHRRFSSQSKEALVITYIIGKKNFNMAILNQANLLMGKLESVSHY